MRKILSLPLMTFLISCQTPELKPIELCFQANDVCVCSMYQVNQNGAGQVGESYPQDLQKCQSNDVSLNLDDTQSVLNFFDETVEFCRSRYTPDQ
jgi:hypothetical protein